MPGSNCEGALPTDENTPADIGTKTLSADRIVHLLRLLAMDAARVLLDNRGVERRRHNEAVGEIRR